VNLKETVLKQIKEIMPDGIVLHLSLTGSRAFGWGSDRFDYDVHGIFYRDNYWDWVHNGIEGIDLNLWELRHIFMDIEYQHFEMFQNMANPIYSVIDWKEMLNLCCSKACDEYSIILQYDHLRHHEHARTALHCYRVAMIRIHWLETRQFELNIFKINRGWGLKMLEPLKEEYLTGKKCVDYSVVWRELNFLLDTFRELKASVGKETLDVDRFTAWKTKTLKLCNRR